jgi:hypothetical protein
MPYVVRDSIAGHADALGRALVCSWTEGDRDAGRVHLVGAVDFASVPELEQTLDRPQLAARLVVLELRDLDPKGPPFYEPVQLAEPSCP